MGQENRPEKVYVWSISASISQFLRSCDLLQAVQVVWTCSDPSSGPELAARWPECFVNDLQEAAWTVNSQLSSHDVTRPQTADVLMRYSCVWRLNATKSRHPASDIHTWLTNRKWPQVQNLCDALNDRVKLSESFKTSGDVTINKYTSLFHRYDATAEHLKSVNSHLQLRVVNKDHGYCQNS